MSAPQVRPAGQAGPRGGSLAEVVRPRPQFLLAHRPGVNWLTAQLPADWAPLRADGDAAILAEERPLLVRWGSADGADGSRLTLNGKDRLLAVQDLRWVRELWAAARVRTLPAEVRPSQLRRRLRIDVFNGLVLAVHTLGRGGNLAPLSWQVSREGLLVAWHAMRAMHALRLDFGAVWIGVHGYRTYALQVDPAPPLTRRLARHYADALRSLEQSETWWPGDEPRSEESVVLGADPEFVLRERATGRMIAASDFFPRFGSVGCDRQVMDRATRSLALVEVRPAPSENPADVVNHIREALVQAARRMPGPEVQWLAGSRPFPRFAIGGHIHFSNVTQSRHLLVALDNYLALPVMMLERATTSRLRRHKYGFLGDVRLKEHGGFEYRTLPSWLVSPNLARGILSLAKLVARDHCYLQRDRLAGAEAQNAFHACNKDFFYEQMAEVWRDLEKAPSYANCEADLAVLRTMIEKRQRWNEQVNIRETWRV